MKHCPPLVFVPGFQQITEFVSGVCLMKESNVFQTFEHPMFRIVLVNRRVVHLDQFRIDRL